MTCQWRNFMKVMNKWSAEKEATVQEVKNLLESNYEVQVDSPDGFVPVIHYIEKGMWDEYLLETIKGKKVRCNENHLFETDRGWISAKNLMSKTFLVLGEEGFTVAIVKKTGKKIPIVDITVDHPNHRYYTNGVSSHNTGVGKSLFLCHHATNCLLRNKNVLYITCEMSEERIAERIDANILNTPIQDLKKLTKEMYDKKLERALMNVKGRLIIKEYPTATANVTHFRNLINELRLKKNFSPDVLMVDYLNICASARFKGNTSANSYTYVKSIAEELRGLAVELNIPIFTATQANRGGYNNSDIDLSNTSESYGLPSTADLLVALIGTEELDELNQILVKQLKNRYNDPSMNKKFVLGIDRSKMKLYDVEEHAQNALVDSGQLGTEIRDSKDKMMDKFKKSRSFENWEM